MVKTQGVVHFSLPVTDLERRRSSTPSLGMKIVQKTLRMVFLKCGDDYFILAKDTPVKYGSLEQPLCIISKRQRTLILLWSFSNKNESKYSTWKTAGTVSSGAGRLFSGPGRQQA